MTLTAPPPASSLTTTTAPPGALDGGFEQLVVANDPAVGLTAVICVDSSVLGPADGGVRMRPYPSFEAAVADVTRLARSMTRKFAAAGEARGGGKAVIVGDPRHDKTDALLHRFGEVVESLGGRYWAGQDAGIDLADMATIGAATRFVSTLPADAGGAGEIAPTTAAGVLHAMRACVERVWGRPDLAGRSIALQGLGACGMAALEQLVAEGARVIVADVDEARVRLARERFGVEAVSPERIVDVPADVFAPFAYGGVIDDDVAERLAVRVVAGSANDVLAHPGVEARLDRRGIVYAVDFVANAGGAILDADRFRPDGPDPEAVARRVAAIGPRTAAILEAAERHGCTATDAALALVQQRLEGARAARAADEAAL